MTLLGGTSVIGVIQAVRYRKENKKLKENEVKVSNVEAQRQEMELAEMYKDKVLELLEQVSQKQESGNDNQALILKKLDDLDKRLDKVEGKVGNMETYLNGKYQDFLRHLDVPAKPSKPRKPKTKQ